jgi:hypothetical protein
VERLAHRPSRDYRWPPRTLFGKLAFGELPQKQKRARRAEEAQRCGVISPCELA